jgi:hypothetical protein
MRQKEKEIEDKEHLWNGKTKVYNGNGQKQHDLKGFK